MIFRLDSEACVFGTSDRKMYEKKNKWYALLMFVLYLRENNILNRREQLNWGSATGSSSAEAREGGVVDCQL